MESLPNKRSKLNTNLTDHSSSTGEDPGHSNGRKTIVPRSEINIYAQSYQRLHDTPQFIDQTEFIKIVMNNESKIQFVGGPRRFGKSVRADMMATFFDIPRDKGMPLIINNPSESPNYRYFENTKIAKDEDFMRSHFGKYPVVYLDFSYNASFSIVSSERRVETEFKYIISKAYETHRYLCDSTRLDGASRSTCAKWCTPSLPDIKSTNIANSLLFLIKCLCQHHGKPVFIIMDEVDAPCVSALFSLQKSARRLFNFIRHTLANILNPILKFLQTWKGTFDFVPCVKLYMTGMSFTVTGLSVINNVTLIPFLRNKFYVPYCGFNASDVESLCERYGLSAEDKQTITECYNGPHYWKYHEMNKGHDILDKFEIYNPFHVLKHINMEESSTFQPPPFICQMTRLLTEHEEVIWIFQHLLDGHNVEYLQETQLDEDMLMDLQKMIDRFSRKEVAGSEMLAFNDDFHINYRVKTKSTATFLMFLADIGCFTFVAGAAPGHVCVALPNSDVRNYFRDIYYQKFGREQISMLREKLAVAIQIDYLLGLVKAERNTENVEKISASLNKIETCFGKIVNREFNLAGKQFSESNVVDELVHIFNKLRKVRAINSEYSKKNSLGESRRVDIQVAVDETMQMIVEVKKSNEKTEPSADAALDQIFDREYMHGVKTEFALALGCCVTQISSNEEEKNFICKFNAVGGETSSLKEEWEKKRGVKY